MKKLSKKAALTWYIIVPFILAVLFVTIIIFTSTPFFQKFWQASKHYSVEERLKICIRYGESGRDPDTDLSEDNQKDGLPDFCDNCPRVYGKPIDENGMLSFDKKIDADRDLFVKGCTGNDGKGGIPSGKLITENDGDEKEHPKYNWQPA